MLIWSERLERRNERKLKESVCTCIKGCCIFVRATQDPCWLPLSCAVCARTQSYIFYTTLCSYPGHPLSASPPCGNFSKHALLKLTHQCYLSPHFFYSPSFYTPAYCPIHTFGQYNPHPMLDWYWVLRVHKQISVFCVASFSPSHPLPPTSF